MCVRALAIPIIGNVGLFQLKSGRTSVPRLPHNEQVKHAGTLTPMTMFKTSLSGVSRLSFVLFKLRR